MRLPKTILFFFTVILSFSSLANGQKDPKKFIEEIEALLDDTLYTWKFKKGDISVASWERDYL